MTPWDLVVADWFLRPLRSPTPRRARTAQLPGKVDAVYGMRRSGKTFLLLGELAERHAAGLPRSHALYVSLEDERLGKPDAASLGGMLDAWHRRFPEVVNQECWLILDEVHEVEGWERFVRRLIDRGGIRMAVTGSSAKLSSREIATNLRGRAMALELLPFAFDEILRHRGIATPSTWPAGGADRARLASEFDRYLEEGGFPEILGVSELDRVRMLRDYVDVVLFRDVVERHATTNVPTLRRIVHRLASAPATTLSAHKLYKDLRSQGIAVSKDTLYAYLDHVEDAFLGFRVPIFTESERVRATNPVKSYPIDVGLARAHSARPDAGRLLETAVYLELRRRGGDIAWYRTRRGHEVDFVIRGGRGDLFGATTALVQVCDDVSEPETRARELRALEEAMAELSAREATLITRRTSENVRLESGDVHVVPAWEWALR